MALRVFSALLGLCAAVTTAHAAIDRQFERVLPAADGVRISVDLAYGSIRVVPGKPAEVRVSVIQSVEAEDDAAAQREWKNLIFDAESDRNGAVTVKASDRRALRWSWEKWPPSNLVMELTVPPRCSLDLFSRVGDITVGSVEGSVRIRALSGGTFVAEIGGPVSVNSGGGDVTITSCRGDLNVKAAAGSVLVGRCGGAADISVTSGMLEIQSAGTSLDADVSGGELKAAFTHPLTAPAELKATGDVVVSFAPGCAATIDAKSARSGQVHVRDLTVVPRVGQPGEAKLEAELRGGGPRVVVRSGGNVRLLGLPDLPEPKN